MHRLICNTQHNIVPDMNTYAEAVDNHCRQIRHTAIVCFKMASYCNRKANLCPSGLSDSTAG